MYMNTGLEKKMKVSRFKLFFVGLLTRKDTKNNRLRYARSLEKQCIMFWQL